MSIFSKIFSSSEVVKDVSEGITNGVDKAIYTTEEQAENFHVLLQLYTPFKIIQRFLALIFCVPYVLAWLAVFVVNGLMNIEVDSALELLNGDMGTIVITIAVFYFGGGALEGTVSAFKQGVKK